MEITVIAPGRFALQAPRGARVRSEATIQRRSDDGAWQASAPFRLRQSCGSDQLASCLDIPVGGTLVPLSWDGVECGPCCDEPANRQIDAGTQRLLLTRCEDESSTWPGPAFDMPGSTRALERQRAAAHVVGASVMQLGRRPPQPVAGVPSIAEHPIVDGTERPLSDADVTALGAWLRDAGGFDDDVMKRCLRGQTFGFQIARRAAGSGDEKTQIVVDLQCNSIAVVNQQGPLTTRSGAYFDGSRATLLELLRSAQPSAKLPAR